MNEKLAFDYELLKKQLFWLEHSYSDCSEIGIQKEYSIEEIDKFEILTSRYARSIDFLVRKFFRTLDMFEFENQGTLIDVVNNAHKRNLFESVDELRIMKDLRNSIVHEYVEDALTNLFDDVLAYSETLIYIIKKTMDYTEETHLKDMHE